MPGDCGAAALANQLKTDLLVGETVNIPVIDLSGSQFQIPDPDPNDPIFGQLARLTLEELTEKIVDGNGAFDGLMTAMKKHLQVEYEGGRITGQEYSKTYIALTESALAQASQFLLQRDASFWSGVAAQQNAQLAKIQTIKARVELETAKVQLAMVQVQARNSEAEYAVTKMRLATESVNHCIAQFQLDIALPQANLLAIEQTRGAKEAADMAALQRTDLLPKQVAQLTAQISMIDAQTAGQVFQNEQLMPKQVAQLDGQIAMLREQTEAQRAQTSDTRTDGLPVVGLLGKQKELYAQQITSYKRDAEVKAARMFVDAWITQKTLDEGLLAPNGFTNVSLDQVLSTLKTNNQLG